MIRNRFATAVLFVFVWGFFAGTLFAQHTITQWPYNKKGAISISFDDSLPSHLSMALPALNSFGLKGTFFIITDRITAANNWAAWRAVAAMGHEIASHTKTHPYLTQLSTAQLQSELSESRDVINQQITTQKCFSFAYPYGDYNYAVEIATMSNYIAARGVSNGLNYETLDFGYVMGTGDSSNSLDSLKAWTDQAENTGAWQVVYAHSLDGTGYSFWDVNLLNEYFSYLGTKNIWNDTFGNAAKFVKERNYANLSVISSSSSGIILNLTDGLDDAIYDQPLTVRSVIAADWTRINVNQGSSNVAITPVVEHGDSVIYYQATPDRGPIALSAATPIITALNPASTIVGSPGFSMTVTGANFMSGSTVRWNGSSRATAFVSPAELNATITAADAAIEGVASVSVLNPDGTVSNARSFAINLTEAPLVIITQPASQSVQAGESATFSVAAEGNGILAYQWLRNGTGITGAIGNSYFIATTSMADNGAIFTCVINNNTASVTSSPAILTVTQIPAPPSSLLSNPGFETGVTPWSFYTNASGSFANDAAGDGSAHSGHIVIGQAGTNVQLYQAGITLEPNTQYILSFKAYSNTSRDLSVSLHKHGTPYTNYGLYGECNLDYSWSYCLFELTTSGFSETVNDARMMLWLAPFAAAGDQYFIDDVILAKK
jgi:peptidoglycan/xylan/chitin deacetylase (PgdA/CDA1 family)